MPAFEIAELPSPKVMGRVRTRKSLVRDLTSATRSLAWIAGGGYSDVELGTFKDPDNGILQWVRFHLMFNAILIVSQVVFKHPRTRLEREFEVGVLQTRRCAYVTPSTEHSSRN